MALLGLGRLAEAFQTLTQARSLAEGLGASPQLWLVLASLAEVNAALGNHQEAEASREKARGIVEQVAETLREVGLRESFLNQPWVQALLR
jgi:hypothetical protein